MSLGDVAKLALAHDKQQQKSSSPPLPKSRQNSAQLTPSGLANGQQNSSQPSKKSGSSTLTTSDILSDNETSKDPLSSTSQFRGPFSTSSAVNSRPPSRKHTPPFSRNSGDVVATTQNHLPARPDTNRRSTSATYFFNKLANHAAVAALDGPIVEEPIPNEANASTAQPPQIGRTPTTNSQLQPTGSSAPTASAKGWAALRARLKQQAHDEKRPIDEFSKTLSGHELISELTLGMLPVLMIKMALTDRDEHGDHRIPVLLNYIKLRITDSIYPLHNNHAIFRIELEYGDGLMKWVIYREIKDFYNLHAHYKVTLFTSGREVPAFPKSSLPYYKMLRSQKGLSVQAAKAEFARVQREQLETYLLKLIRSLMFRPEANRLAKFLEISALGLRLAGQGGSTGKQGYLTVMSTGASRKKAPGFHPLAFKQRHEPKWFIVRDSFIAAVTEPDGSELWDVFLFDSDFVLERPKRLYRQGLHKITAPFEHHAENEKEASKSENKRSMRQSSKEIALLADDEDPSTQKHGSEDATNDAHVSLHTFYVRNSERKMKLVAKTERQMEQFIASIERMASKSIWAGQNRFDSFAPIRLNVSAHWLVDGRDYYWNLSEAVSMAKRSIYIHDWWLSPELYLRRPPVLNGEWRLDRLLKRKAEEGVKIFVIIYKEVAQSFTPVDSLYAKNRLHDLHANILVQRSPDSEARSLLWSHHEKLCVIDETIAFMGGLDLCFGRWDTPAHTLVDDRTHGFSDVDRAYENESTASLDQEQFQIWPGKDYANSRASDFFDLQRPEVDMFDRTKIPRQPWHDVGVQLVGQPARDLSRHFVQRWNYLLRSKYELTIERLHPQTELAVKNHSRVMPFLIPPPDFTIRELRNLKIVGTCEAQICRSAGPWSLGTPRKTEHSIQNAYCKAIQLSEAFVYIENQYFSTSTIAENVNIENHIGDALVSRILRAHAEGMPWKACVIIPLTPGYAMPMDSPDAGSVRMIMEAQSRSIYRGEHSIFGRLRREGIDPANYINFFSLRSWGKLKSGQLATQDIYIHNKIMIVDDRIAIIGSANINERSQRGDRDSELAVVIRDTEMLDSKMAGLSFKVGKFAHTMRIRLMREHIGVDVDQLERDGEDVVQPTSTTNATQAPWDPDQEQETGIDSITSSKNITDRYATDAGALAQGLKETFEGAKDTAFSLAGRTHPHVPHIPPGSQQRAKSSAEHSAQSAQSDPEPSLEEHIVKKTSGQLANKKALDPEPAATDAFSEGKSEWSEQELRKLVGRKQSSSVITEEHERSSVDSSRPEQSKPFVFPAEKASSGKLTHEARSSISGASPTAENDGAITSWEQRAHQSSQSNVSKPSPYTIPVPPPNVDPHGFEDPLDDAFYTDVWMQAAARNTEIFRKVFRCTPDDRCLTWTQFKEWDLWEKRHKKPPRDLGELNLNSPMSAVNSISDDTSINPIILGNDLHSTSSMETPRKPMRTKITDEGFTTTELQAMEALLSELRGNLVLYPTKFLESEALAGNNLFAKDRLAPLAIYN